MFSVGAQDDLVERQREKARVRKADFKARMRTAKMLMKADLADARRLEREIKWIEKELKA